ncbi:MAG TPA: hypothetical protein VFQ38_15835 [Longimicrobiales bacterium]|nr:hypothetical protein [Longimicrobiales bacterium]
MAKAKGSTLRATLGFLDRHPRPGTREAVLARLEPELRRTVEGAEPTAELPFEVALALWRAADALLAGEDPGWVERAGADSIESIGMRLYGGILRKASPIEFLTQPVKLFRLYYHSGDMEVVEQAPGRAVLRLVGFDQPDRLFCRRQAGGLRRALELAGGRDASVRHVRCEIEGDAFCEWELRWDEAERG